VRQEWVLEGEEAFEDEHMVVYWGVACLGVHVAEALDMVEWDSKGVPVAGLRYAKGVGKEGTQGTAEDRDRLLEDCWVGRKEGMLGAQALGGLANREVGREVEGLLAEDRHGALAVDAEGDAQDGDRRGMPLRGARLDGDHCHQARCALLDRRPI